LFSYLCGARARRAEALRRRVACEGIAAGTAASTDDFGGRETAVTVLLYPGSMIPVFVENVSLSGINDAGYSSPTRNHSAFNDKRFGHDRRQAIVTGSKSCSRGR